jgi:hypothetical protein
MTARRDFLRTTAALLGVNFARADDPESPSDLINPVAQSGIDRGLAYLGRVQSDDGSFNDTSGPNVAVTGLAAIALMCGGHQPGRGQYGKIISRAMDYVLSRGQINRPAGYLAAGEGISHSGMYQHGFGTLFLAELHGMVPDAARQRRLRDGLEAAVTLIVKSQNSDGGWRYQPKPSEADVSVTVAELMALRAARNAGIFVPKSNVDACVKYIKACQLDDGGFCYIKGQTFSGSLFPRSAAALVGLYSAGIYDGPEVDRALKYLKQYLPGRRLQRDPRTEVHYFYGHYYAALAMWTAGGAHWNEWFPAIRDDLIARAGQGGGTWSDGTAGPAYATAMACIILQLPNNYLPILQK